MQGNSSRIVRKDEHMVQIDGQDIACKSQLDILRKM